MYDLFVTRFSNKTWNESVRYNRKILKTDVEIKEDEIINKWIKITIPEMEKKIKKYQKMIYKVEDKKEKKDLKKNKLKIQKDMEYLREEIRNHYERNTSRMIDDRYVAESKEYEEVWTYNTPIKIHDSVEVGKELYIFELNNDKNKIMGLVRLNNVIEKKKYNKIHDDMNYNRYSYNGIRIDRKDITDKGTLEKIENILFYGSRHQKRGQGIQKVGEESKKEINKLIWDIIN
tara:strand:- start:5948 stop:6643 length:696 start_codon:yes stop_codon:yes gene_type:complete